MGSHGRGKEGQETRTMLAQQPQYQRALSPASRHFLLRIIRPMHRAPGRIGSTRATCLRAVIPPAHSQALCGVMDFQVEPLDRIDSAGFAEYSQDGLMCELRPGYCDASKASISQLTLTSS